MKHARENYKRLLYLLFPHSKECKKKINAIISIHKDSNRKIVRHNGLSMPFSVLRFRIRIRIRWIRKILASYFRIRMQGVKYQPKTAKKTFLLIESKSELLKKKRNYKNVLISEWFIKF